MRLQSLRALRLAPGGPGSFWNHLGEPVGSPGVSGRFVCGFQTDLHFADVALHRSQQGYFSFEVQSCTFIFQFLITDISITCLYLGIFRTFIKLTH